MGSQIVRFSNEWTGTRDHQKWMEGNISLLALDTFQEIETMGVNIVNFEKHQQYLSEDRECAECFFAGNCLGAIQKVCHRTTTDF